MRYRLRLRSDRARADLPRENNNGHQPTAAEPDPEISDRVKLAPALHFGAFLEGGIDRFLLRGQTCNGMPAAVPAARERAPVGERVADGSGTRELGGLLNF